MAHLCVCVCARARACELVLRVRVRVCCVLCACARVQVEGAFIQGMGLFTTEEMVWMKNGQVPFRARTRARARV